MTITLTREEALELKDAVKWIRGGCGDGEIVAEARLLSCLRKLDAALARGDEGAEDYSDRTKWRACYGGCGADTDGLHWHPVAPPPEPATIPLCATRFASKEDRWVRHCLRRAFRIARAPEPPATATTRLRCTCGHVCPSYEERMVDDAECVHTADCELSRAPEAAGTLRQWNCQDCGHYKDMHYKPTCGISGCACVGYVAPPTAAGEGGDAADAESVSNAECATVTAGLPDGNESPSRQVGKAAGTDQGGERGERDGSGILEGTGPVDTAHLPDVGNTPVTAMKPIRWAWCLTVAFSLWAAFLCARCPFYVTFWENR